MLFVCYLIQWFSQRRTKCMHTEWPQKYWSLRKVSFYDTFNFIDVLSVAGANAAPEVQQRTKNRKSSATDHCSPNPCVWLASPIAVQSNPDRVLASILCQSEDFIRTRSLSGLTFLWPCMCAIGLDNANPEHHVYHLTLLTGYWYTKAAAAVNYW